MAFVVVQRTFSALFPSLFPLPHPPQKVKTIRAGLFPIRAGNIEDLGHSQNVMLPQRDVSCSDGYLGVRGVLERKLPFFFTDLAFEAVNGPSMLSGTKTRKHNGQIHHFCQTRFQGLSSSHPLERESLETRCIFLSCLVRGNIVKKGLIVI